MSKKSFRAAGARAFAWSTISAACVLGTAQTAEAQLTQPAIPELDEGAGIIANKQVAIALGKALFWDQMAGSDGVACATCHFSAGADSRIKSQLSPGLLDTEFAGGDSEFGVTRADKPGVVLGRTASGGIPDAAYTLVKGDFPLHRLEDYKNRNSSILSTTNDVVSSAGAYSAQFKKISGGLIELDVCGQANGSIFHAGKFPARQVEPRNTPTTINAGFFYLNFWDGRANNLFNGLDPFGLRTVNGDPNKRLVVLDGTSPKLGSLSIRNASLASQATGPALSEIEMSCAGRKFIDLAEKLLDNTPLMLQEVAPSDSVLGSYLRPPIRLFGLPITINRGLHPQYSYRTLIQQAFDKKYWGAPGNFSIANGKLVVEKKKGVGNTQMEMNFSMFWGLAIMMYERTLVSDQSRFDTWYASCRPAVTNTSGRTNEAPIGNPTVTCVPDASNAVTSTDPVAHGLTAQEVLGFGMFMNAGVGPRNTGNPSCVGCHGPVGLFNAANPPAAGTKVTTPLFTEAAFTAGQTFNPVERSLITDQGDGLPLIPLPTTLQNAAAVHDRGFFNIGVTPTAEDLGIGGRDPYGKPLSLARMFLGEQAGQTVTDPPLVVFPPAGTPLATVTTAINRCASPGIIELGGTPRFLGCAVGATFPDPLLLDITQERELVDGGFKTPSLRNVGLTAPYFHSGNYADLRSTVEFYSRGGSRRTKGLEKEGYIGDTSGTGPLGKGLTTGATHFGTNVDFFMRDVKMTDEQIDALVAFMLSLTDPRVQCDLAPFDHPQLFIPVGHQAVDRLPWDGRADSTIVNLPAVGAAGYAKSSGLCIPNKGDLFAPGMQGRVGGQRVPLQ